MKKTSKRSHRALLGGAQAREAQSALRALSQRFLALRPSSITDPSLCGLAGIALVHAALDSAFPEAGHVRAAQRAIERAGAALATTALSPSLYSGFTGVAWVLELLGGDPSLPPEQDPISAIDEALASYLDQSPWVHPYDVIEGLVGIGVYGLERLPRASAKRLVSLVVDRLADTARPVKPGVAWWSDPEWVPASLRRSPNLEYNLGVAHGVPGVVALLGRITAAPVDARTRSKARRLLDKAVSWLLAQELPKGEIGCFAIAVGPGIARVPTRLAWCYGDAGIAAALLVAAREAGEPAWKRAALRVALRAAARTQDGSGVADPGLCHGAAGNAHIFHRLYRATNDERFATAARTWFGVTLGMRTSRGFGGFLAHVPTPKGKLVWRPDPTFLTGAAGIALALVAATTDGDPAWDRALMLS